MWVTNCTPFRRYATELNGQLRLKQGASAHSCKAALLRGHVPEGVRSPHQRSVLRSHPNAEVTRHAHPLLAEAGEVSKPVRLPFGSVRSVVMHGSEHGEYERAVR